MGLSAVLADQIDPAEIGNDSENAGMATPAKQKRLELVQGSRQKLLPKTWALLRSQGWSVPEDLLTLVVKLILDARARPAQDDATTPATFASIDDLWRNGLPVTVDVVHGPVLMEQWTITLDWRDASPLPDAHMEGLDTLLAELADHWAEFPCDAAAHRFAVGANSTSGAIFAPFRLRERRFADVLTAMGRLMVTVTHAPSPSPSHGDGDGDGDRDGADQQQTVLAVPGPAAARTIRVRADVHTSNVVQHAAILTLPTMARQAAVSPLASSWSAGRMAAAARPMPMPMRRARQLVGAYEENMLQGRLGAGRATTIPGFTARLSVASAGRTPGPVAIPFAAQFWVDAAGTGAGAEAGAGAMEDVMQAPYVGVIDVARADGSATARGVYRVPAQGSLNIAISNPTGTLMKVFVVRYDLHDMPPSHKTFVRQSYRQGGAVKGAIHVTFASSSKGGVYVYGGVRAMFSYRTDEARVAVSTSLPDPKYSPYPAHVRLAALALAAQPASRRPL